MTKWQDIEAFIMRYMEEHDLGAGDRLPSDHEMLTIIGRTIPCSLQPLIRAMNELVRSGILRRTPGSGTTVLSTLPVMDDHDFSFSFTSTKTRGAELATQVLEKARRLPLPGETNAHERRAQKALGLKRNEPFYVIVRRRFLRGRPRVIHRSHLNPALLPDTFLWDHDLTRESLIAVLNAHGYQMETRKTTLRARFPTDEEMVILGIKREPVLEAEQELGAIQEGTGKHVVIEYLQAIYVNWEYKIADRRAT